MKLKIFGLIVGFFLTMPLHIVAAQTSSAQPTDDAGQVENATFTSDVVDGAPTDYTDEFSNQTSKVYYYTDLLGLKGQTAVHRWKHEGKVIQEVKIAVDKERMPAWSMNEMQPELTGAWSVEVVDGGGKVIHMDSFSYESPL
jgi:hypothetical protein